MMTLTINKGLETEKVIALTSYYERPLAGTFSGTNLLQVKKVSDIPDYSGLTEGMLLSSLELRNGDGLLIPLSGIYNRLDDINCNYDDETRSFRATIAIGRVLLTDEEE